MFEATYADLREKGRRKRDASSQHEQIGSKAIEVLYDSQGPVRSRSPSSETQVPADQPLAVGAGTAAAEVLDAETEASRG